MDTQVENFLQVLEQRLPTHAGIISRVRESYQSYCPTIIEKYIYGGISFFINTKMIGGTYPRKGYVVVIFSRGNELQDPESLLQGEGKCRRYLEIYEIEDLTVKKVDNFIRQVIALEV